MGRGKFLTDKTKINKSVGNWTKIWDGKVALSLEI
jgi:hypothetical protein